MASIDVEMASEGSNFDCEAAHIMRTPDSTEGKDKSKRIKKESIYKGRTCATKG